MKHIECYISQSAIATKQAKKSRKTGNRWMKALEELWKEANKKQADKIIHKKCPLLILDQNYRAYYFKLREDEIIINGYNGLKYKLRSVNNLNNKEITDLYLTGKIKFTDRYDKKFRNTFLTF